MKKILILLLIFVAQGVCRADYTINDKEINLVLKAEELVKKGGGRQCDYEVRILKDNNILITRSFYAENAHCKWDERLRLQGYIPVSFWDNGIKSGDWIGTLLMSEENLKKQNQEGKKK